MFAVEKGAKTALRLELIQGTKNYYSITIKMKSVSFNLFEYNEIMSGGGEL